MTETSFIHLWPASRREQFSYDALKELFAFMEEFDEDWEFDPIALCCEWTEYGNAIEACEDWGEEDCYIDVDVSEQEEAALAWLQDRTTVIQFDTGILVQQF
jgi:hypothetical protein